MKNVNSTSNPNLVHGTVNVQITKENLSIDKQPTVLQRVYLLIKIFKNKKIETFFFYSL